jgi:hypothetical protein
MTNEKATKDLQALIAQHGFTYEGEQTYDGREIYTRRWTKTSQVVWYGERESTLEIKISMNYGIPKVRIIRNGRRDDKVRDYSSPKRAFNAIGEIVRCAGYEM